MQQIRKILSIGLSLVLLSACEEPKQFDLRTADGKTSPYQNVKTVYLTPNFRFAGCSEGRSEIPDYIMPDAIWPILTERIYMKSTFNRAVDRKYRAISKRNIKVGKAPQTLGANALQISFFIEYHCDVEVPYLSFRWRTRRNLSQNAFVRTNKDRWFGLPHPGDSDFLPFNLPKDKIILAVKNNSFERLEFDDCDLRTTGTRPKTTTPIVKCR